jgi:hypothetical protein
VAAHVRERAFDGADDVGDRDLVRRPREGVPALLPAAAVDDARTPQVTQDVLRKFPGMVCACAICSAVSCPPAAASSTAARTA